MISQKKIKQLSAQVSPRGTEPDIYFEGLPEGIRQWDVFQFVQNIGKQLGLSGTAVGHLHYLVSHTYDVDWCSGNMPIVYRSVMSTATDRGLTERQVQNIEETLHKAGLIQWKDREDYKRYGQRRGEKGPIMFAFGVDLSPLARQYHALLELNKQHINYMEVFSEMRRKVSNLRTQIRRKIKRLEAFDVEISDFSREFDKFPRIKARLSLDVLASICNQARALNNRLNDILQQKRGHVYTHMAASENDHGPNKISGVSEINFRRLQPILSPQSINIDCNQQVVDDKEDVNEKFSTGIEHISHEMAIDAASDKFLECLSPTRDKVSDLVNAASRMCHKMGIGRHAWVKASAVMGDTAAAVAVLIIDRNRQHPIIPVVNPGGALRGMTAKAKIGDLNLHRSLYAIMVRDNKTMEAISMAQGGQTNEKFKSYI